MHICTLTYAYTYTYTDTYTKHTHQTNTHNTLIPTHPDMMFMLMVIVMYEIYKIRPPRTPGPSDPPRLRSRTELRRSWEISTWTGWERRQLPSPIISL
jgi:hypothetical protein